MEKCQLARTKELGRDILSESLPCFRNNDCSQKTDEEIAQMAKTNKDCFIFLMSRYEIKIKKYVSRISGNSKETVDDLAQDIFLRVYLNLEKFDENQKFSPWIYRIAHNVTINFWLANKKRQQKENWDIADAPGSVLKNDEDIEAEISQKIVNEKMVETFKQLNDKYRQVLVLNYLEQKNYKEIAKELKKPVSTIGTLLSQAKKLLRVELLKAGLTPETIY